MSINPHETEFQKQSRSIFEKFSENLRSTPAIFTAVLAASPAAIMIMGGMGLDAHESMKMMDVLGHEAFQAYKEAGKHPDVVEAIKTAMTGGHQTIGANVAFLGMAAAPILPALAIISKGVAHAVEFMKDLTSRTTNDEKVEATSKFQGHLDSMNQAVAQAHKPEKNFNAFYEAVSRQAEPAPSRGPKLSM